MFNKILDIAIKNKVSDIHLKTGEKIYYRKNTSLKNHDDKVINQEEMKKIIRHLLKDNIEGKKKLCQEKNLDLIYPYNNYRFRINLYFSDKKRTIAIRMLKNEFQDLEKLNLPKKLKEIAFKNKGLFLITGATGSGKSTTLASLIDIINKNSNKHIITLENPIEYKHENKKSLINQRELGEDFNSFASGLKASLRQDPDVIMVGEMRDLETISTAITASETGHLVLSTLHTNTASETIQRIIDIFPANQQAQIKTQLSMNLLGVLSQELIPKRLDGGLILATEFLLKTKAISNLIRENKIHQIDSIIETNRNKGMHTLKHSKKELIKEGLIDSNLKGGN